jgi:hypothetical protein
MQVILRSQNGDPEKEQIAFAQTILPFKRESLTN